MRGRGGLQIRGQRFHVDCYSAATELLRGNPGRHLAAADKGDYAALRPLVDADVFLSDFGFGEESDPAGRWEKMGSQPLETMGVLLRMRHVVRKTNEGTLYHWPVYDPDSDPGDLTARDEERFATVMSKAELERLITDEYGYTGPKLGILEDGTWWFFLLEGGP